MNFDKNSAKTHKLIFLFFIVKICLVFISVVCWGFLGSLSLLLFSDHLDHEREQHQRSSQPEWHNCFVYNGGNSKGTSLGWNLVLQFELFDDDCRLAGPLDEEIHAQEERPGKSEVCDDSDLPVLLESLSAVHGNYNSGEI